MKRRRRANLLVVGAFAALAAFACVDLSAPKGPASISTLILPSLFVVQGDVMRDSVGNPAKPTIIAFDQHGDTVGGFTPSFFLTDSIPRAHFDPATGIIHGDSLGIAHLVGQIGNIQTAVFNLPITVAPDSIFRVLVSVADTLRGTVGTDSASSRATIPAQVRVTGANNTPVQGVRVTFTLVNPLASRVSTPAVYLTQPSTDNRSQVDTTKSDGSASRQVILISKFLADQTIFTGRIDSVIVKATATYRGVSLHGSPVRIVIPVKVGF